MDKPASTGCIEEVIITDALDRRPSRAVDYGAENRALRSLAEAMAKSPATVLQELAEVAMEVTDSDSAGISLLEPGGENGQFRWVATAGQWAPFLHGTMPREASPCGEVIARNSVLLLTEPARAFPALLQADTGVREVLLAPFHVDGEPIGTVWVIKHSTGKSFEREDARLLKSLAHFASVAHRMVHALDNARAGEREGRAALEAELAGRRSLQRLSTRFIPEQSFDALFEQILDTALELMQADAASIQLLNDDGTRLRRVATRNLHPESTEYWTWVDASHASTCGQALRKSERVVLNDVEVSPELVGTGDLAAFRASGTRAVQSTPLLTRVGRPIGMISTHWRAPRRLEETDFGLFDILARQIADLIERSEAQRLLRESKERQTFLLKLSDTLRPLTDGAQIEREATRLLGEHLLADRCFLSPVYDDGLGMCVREEYLRSGASSVLGDYTFAQFGDFVGPTLHAGHILAVENVSDLPKLTADERASYAAVEIGAYLLVPVTRGGRLAAFLTINHRTPRAWSDADKAVARQTADRLWTSLERARVETALRDSEAERRSLIAQMNEGFCILEVIVDDAGNGVDYRFLETNPAFVRQGGFDPAGRLMSEIAPIEPIWPAAYGRVATTGVPERIVESAAAFNRTYEVYAFRVGVAANRRVAVFFTDITARTKAEAGLRESEQHSQLLLAELQHRVRNTLAVVRSIARRTAENSSSVEEMLAHFQGRLDAFSRVQAALTRNPNSQVNLMLLVEDELVAHAAREGARVKIRGPDIMLEPRTAERLSLAIHELTTNAVKHGALSGKRGGVIVEWSSDDRRLDLSWKESGVGVRHPPKRSGFGMELLLQTLPFDLQAETNVNWRREGVEFCLKVPLKPLQPGGNG